MTAIDLVADWARAFGVTLIVELAVGVPLLTRQEPALWRRLALVTIAQFVSHPVLWFVLPTLLPSRAAFLVIAESWAWLGEASFYWVAVPPVGPRDALLVSFAANAASLAVGLALRGVGVNL